MCKLPDPGGSSVSPSGTPQQLPPITPASSHSEKLGWFRNVFRPHFESWVFGPINRHVHSEDALVGFILIACAIDWLAGFWWGKSTKRDVERAYTGFIDEYFSEGLYDAGGLYDSLRNGLVHMFTIKNKKYILTHNNPSVHLKVDGNARVVLNAGDFRDELEAAKNRYFDAVEANPELLDRLVERYHRDGFLHLGIVDLPD